MGDIRENCTGFVGDVKPFLPGGASDQALAGAEEGRARYRREQRIESMFSIRCHSARVRAGLERTNLLLHEFDISDGEAERDQGDQCYELRPDQGQAGQQ